MSASITVSRKEPASADAVRAVSAVSTGTVQIHPEHPFGTSKPLYWWLLASRRWTPPRPVTAYVIEHTQGLILFHTGQDRALVTDDGYFPGGLTGLIYDRLARFDIGEQDTLTAQLGALGYSPADVVTVFEPASRLAIHRQIGPFQATISYALDAAAGSTRLVNSVELDPSQPKLRLLAPVITPRIKAAVAQNLGKLKLVLESGRPAKDFCRGNAIGTVKANYIK
jgi:hypothetical protein